MDWKLLGSTFVVVFLAELGDKTQLATFSLAAGGTSRWMVFLGAALALIATTAIAVIVGEGVSRVVPEVWLQRGAGAAFIVLRAWFLLRSGS
jgi:putative Ca2+/H+ antiporter (TMEM165/GDT1 family)